MGPGGRQVSQTYQSIHWREGSSPTPKPTTKTEMGTRATSWLTPNDSETPPISEVMTLEQNATTKHVMATTMVMYHLKGLDQFLGFPGSPSAKETSLKSCRVSPFGALPSFSMVGEGCWTVLRVVWCPSSLISSSSMLIQSSPEGYDGIKWCRYNRLVVWVKPPYVPHF